MSIIGYNYIRQVVIMSIPPALELWGNYIIEESENNIIIVVVPSK